MSASPRDFDRVRDSEAFAELMTLGRIANLLRAGLHCASEHGGTDGTPSRRARMAMTLLVTGVVAEALPVLERSGKHFRHLPAFEEAIRPILTDPTVKSLREQWLLPLRNQAVFHNDCTVSERGLRLMSPGVAQDLARSSGLSTLDVYYPTADNLAILYIIDSAHATDDPSGFLNNALYSVVDVARRVCLAIDIVLGQALSELGFTWEEVGSTAG